MHCITGKNKKERKGNHNVYITSTRRPTRELSFYAQPEKKTISQTISKLVQTSGRLSAKKPTVNQPQKRKEEEEESETTNTVSWQEEEFS